MDCPHCGGVIDAGAPKPLLHPVFDDARRCIVVDGNSRWLTASWWRVLLLLRERPGRYVRYDFLATANERIPGDGGSLDAVKIHIMQLRRALQGTPFAIATMRMVGYGLFPASDVEHIQFRKDSCQTKRLNSRLRASWRPTRHHRTWTVS